jgi:hypothetical protein
LLVSFRPVASRGIAGLPVAPAPVLQADPHPGRGSGRMIRSSPIRV